MESNTTITTYDRLNNQCKYCTYSEYTILSQKYKCNLKQRDVYSPTPCIAFNNDNYLTELRKFYKLINGESQFKDKRNTMIKFLFDFYEPVCCGVKKATTRLTDKKLNINDVCIGVFPFSINDFNKDVPETYVMLELLITNVEQIKYKNLTRAHAFNEGYLHLNLLKHELKNIYPTITEDTILYTYTFKIINEK